MADFASFDDCIDYIQYVDEHPEVYESIIRTPAFTETNSVAYDYEDQLRKFFRDIVEGSFKIKRQPGYSWHQNIR